MPDYCFRRTLRLTLDEAVKALSDSLFAEGFDVLQETVGESSERVKIFAWYPKIGQEAPGHISSWVIGREERTAAGTPCTIILELMPSGAVEVAAVDPIKSLNASRNSRLYKYAGIIRQKLMAVIHRL